MKSVEDEVEKEEKDYNDWWEINGLTKLLFLFYFIYICVDKWTKVDGSKKECQLYPCTLVSLTVNLTSIWSKDCRY